MSPFVEKKKKPLCLVSHISTKKPPTLFFQPRTIPPIIPTSPIINKYYNVLPPAIIPTPPIIRDSRVLIRMDIVFLPSLEKHCVKSVQIQSFLWPVVSSIRTEYKDLLRKSSYSVQMWGNRDQKKLIIWTLFIQWKWMKPLNRMVESVDLRYFLKMEAVARRCSLKTVFLKFIGKPMLESLF